MLVLKNATVVEFYPAVIQTGWDIVIAGSKIVAAGVGAAANVQTEQVLDLQGKMVMPGLVCSHNHFYSGLARGITANIAPSPDFISVLKNLWWRLDLALDEEILYYSALVCSLEAIRCGTTAVIDHHASPAFIKGSLKTLKKAFMETGLRGITCYETTDRNRGLQEAEAGIEENVDFAKLCASERIATDGEYLVEAMIGGHAPVTLPDSALQLLAEAVRATGRGLHVHVAEDRYDVAYSHHLYSKDLIVRLQDYGLIDEMTLLVHGVYLSEQEIEIINVNDAFLAHNARSNMNNCVGYSSKLPLYKNLVLGTDGMGSDMWAELKFAYFKHKDKSGPLWPDSYVRFLNNGNKILQRYFAADFGHVAVGCKADLVVLDYQSPTPLLAGNIGGHLAFGLDSRDVSDVIINGKIVLANRQFPFAVSAIYAQARKAAQRLWDRMDKLP